MPNYFVEIRRRSDDGLEKTLNAKSERNAYHIERGVNINLNHDEYYTEVVCNEDSNNVS